MIDQNPYSTPASDVHRTTNSIATSRRYTTLLYTFGGLGATLHWMLLGIGVSSGFLISTEKLAEFVIIATVLLRNSPEIDSRFQGPSGMAV